MPLAVLLGLWLKAPPEHATLFLYASVTLLFNLSCAIYTHKAAKRLNSPLLKTDALEWRLDTVYNISILGAFSLAFILDHIGYAAHAAYVDPIVYIFFSIYMCISPSKLFFENMQILSVGSVDKKTHSHLVSLFKKEIPVFKTHATHFTIFTEDIFDVTEKCQAILNQTYPNNKLSYTYHLEA